MLVTTQRINASYSGYITTYKDIRGWYQVQISPDGQRMMNPKQFELKSTLDKYVAWVIKNWDTHVKKVNVIKTTWKTAI